MFRSDIPIDQLRNLLIFADCDDKLLRKVSRLGTEVHAKVRQVLAREGQPGREFYVIVEGSAEVLIGEKAITTLERGDFFGEMALIDGKPRSASVIAATPMTLYVFDPREFFSLLNDFPPVNRQIFRGLAERLRQAQSDADHGRPGRDSDVVHLHEPRESEAPNRVG